MGMKRNALPSLFDVVAFDDPLEMLLACHRRIEKQLDTLKRLRAHLVANGVDPEASAAAQAVLRYFERAATNHPADEERELVPLVAAPNTATGARARFKSVRAEIERDHREIETMWTKLRRPLEGIAEGLTRTLPSEDVHAFVGAYARHILAEETALAEFFNRWINDVDRRALGRSMSARRQVESRGSL